jgi:hypothetical protein
MPSCDSVTCWMHSPCSRRYGLLIVAYPARAQPPGLSPQEVKMVNPQMRRQRTFAFAKVELWRQIPEQQRSLCQELIEQLLERVFQSVEDERSEHERKDP